MNILELVNDLDAGGAQRVVSNLALYLQSRGHNVHLVCLRELGVPPIPEARLRESGVRLSALGKRDGFSMAAADRLTEFARSARSDVIHTHNPLVNHYGVLAAFRARVPVVVNTIHGINTLRQTLLANWLFDATCLFTTRVVAVCRAVGEVCRKRLPLSDSRSAVIYNGIELDAFLAVPPRHAGSKFRFGTVSRLDPIKDHRSLLEAFAQVHSLQPGCELHILGKGETETELRQVAQKLGIGAAVHFRGFSREIAAFLAEMDCFVISSLSEGLPMAVLEAMASGLPVVGTAVGGVSELIEDADCGWLSPPGKVGELAKSMLLALSATDLAERGARARASAVENYSVDTMGRNYLALFEALLNGKRCPH
jgi:glycosyltransferase involved in cell wall biosynthesis